MNTTKIETQRTMVQRQTEAGGMVCQTGKLHSTGEGGEKPFHTSADGNAETEQKREARALNVVLKEP